MPDTFEVVLTKRAQDEIDQAHDWWAEHRSPEQANRLYLQFFEVMISLERTQAAASSHRRMGRFDYELRQFSFGLGSSPKHRALFVIRDATVLILRIRHLAQRHMAQSPVGKLLGVDRR